MTPNKMLNTTIIVNGEYLTIEDALANQIIQNVAYKKEEILIQKLLFLKLRSMKSESYNSNEFNLTPIYSFRALYSDDAEEMTETSEKRRELRQQLIKRLIIIALFNINESLKNQLRKEALIIVGTLVPDAYTDLFGYTIINNLLSVVQPILDYYEGQK
jgi:hypothetical protein